MLIIACVATILFILFLTRMMVTTKTNAPKVHTKLSSTATVNRSPSFILETNVDKTPWYMQPLKSDKKQ